MKNIGSFVKKHGVKQVISLLYLIPSLLLLVGLLMIAISMFKAPETERTMYLIGIGVLLILIIILLVARTASLPRYSFEMYENGIKIIYKNDKTPNEEYCFDEIPEIWHIAVDGGNKTTHVAFKGNDSLSYYVISSKISDSKGLIHNLTNKVNAQLLPGKSSALTQGERLVFAMLPAGGEHVMTSEKAIAPYLQQSKKEHLSVDRFSLFDGQKTFALADISSVNLDEKGANILVKSIAGTTLYTQNYFSICNANLFLELMKGIVAHPTEKPSEIV